MTWTYTSTSLTDLNKVRRLVGDTDTNDPLIQDEIITDALSSLANVYLSAAKICRLELQAALIRRIDRTGTGFSATRSQIVQHCRDLAKDLEVEANRNAEVTVGGVSESDRDTVNADSDFLQPMFTKDHGRNNG